MQSPLRKSKRATRKAQALAWTHSVEGRSSVREQAALIGPVERQIEFGKTRRSEFDGLPALQDRLDQLRAKPNFTLFRVQAIDIVRNGGGGLSTPWG